jgi:hypothetical protein
MMVPKGTTSEVTQSIDTWSFGCVLSVAATWVVLGFQGVRQYEKLRWLSPANKKTHDRFHNGIDVLPEVKKWHNYLRGHLRKSDTATSLVLDLIEHSMLQTETNDRLGMMDLCKRLQKVIKDAKEEIANLETHTKITDDLVKQALLSIEAEAQALSSKPKTNPLRRRSKEVEASYLPNSSEQDSVPLWKDAAIRSTPLGQTTFRKEILESELQGKSFVGIQDRRSHTQGHGGALTESPVDAHPTELAQLGHKESPHLQPIARNKYYGDHEEKKLAPSSDFQGDSSWSLSNGTYAVSSIRASSDGRSYASSDASHTPPQHLTQFPHDPISSASSTTQIDTLGRLGTEFPSAHQPVRTLGHGAPQWSPEGFEESVLNNTANAPIMTHKERFSSQAVFENPGSHAESYTGDSIHLSQPVQRSSTDQAQLHTSYTPYIKAPIPRSSYLQTTSTQSNPEDFSSMSSLSPASPSITVTSYPGPSVSNMSQSARPFGSCNTEKQVVALEEHRHIHYEELPVTVYDLPYDICSVRKEIDNEKPKGMRSHLKGMFHGEERKANSTLKKTYGNDREIVSSLQTTPVADLTSIRF